MTVTGMSALNNNIRIADGPYLHRLCIQASKSEYEKQRHADYVYDESKERPFPLFSLDSGQIE